MGRYDFTRLNKWLNVAHNEESLIDSVSIPVVGFHLVTGSTDDRKASDAVSETLPRNKQTIFGFKLHRFSTLRGVVLDFELALTHV